MAEYLFRDMVQKKGLSDCFHIASAATSREEIGNPVYPPARRELQRHGIGCSGHAARQITKADYENFDCLICMESYNIRNALRIWGSDPEGKITRLLDHTNRPGDVADPWYTGDFETTYQDVLRGCEGLLAHILGA